VAIVTITPPGRNRKSFIVSGVSRTWDIDGGCATASIPLMLSAEDRERIGLANVRISGGLGMDWEGFVWRRPRAGEPIECAGQAVGLTLTPREAQYAKTNFLGDLKDWKHPTTEYNDAAFERTNSGGKLTICQRAGTTTNALDKAGFYLFGDVSWQRLIATVNKPHAKMSMRIVTGATEAAYTTARYASTDGATGTEDIDIDLGGDRNINFIGAITTGATVNRSDTFVELYDITLYGTTLTAPITPLKVVTDCVDALPTWVLPAGAQYRRRLTDPAVTIGNLGFDAESTDKTKCDSAVAMTACHFGFYVDRIDGSMFGVPVFEPISTTPDFIIDVRAALSDSLRDRGIEALANSYLTRYSTVDGGTLHATVPDATAGNYLNEIGYSKTAVVDASWTTSATDATAAGTQAAAIACDTEGAVTIARARLVNGRECSPLLIMPGKMCRVLGLGAARNLVVRSVTATDASVSVTFAPTGTDLRYLASKALGRAVVRY